MKHPSYCPDLFNYARRQSREVQIGSLTLGGNNPIRVQSMTTTDTLDVHGTVAQSIRMIEAGCELVRITAPSKREAEQLGEITRELRQAGHDTPLVADIHFTPNAAEIAAEHVEKVRVNPGNYADKKRFEHVEYTDESYAEELARIREKIHTIGPKVQATRTCHADWYQSWVAVGQDHEPLWGHAIGNGRKCLGVLTNMCRPGLPGRGCFHEILQSAGDGASLSHARRPDE